ncbi:hypothetical protein, partial [Burkholderia sp. Ap-962]|uniref:hypothetical protein n=1 Tax=Burkholderia sp. Ap-962 TaxID=2608333 RepID=UPI0019628271
MVRTIEVLNSACAARDAARRPARRAGSARDTGRAASGSETRGDGDRRVGRFYRMRRDGMEAASGAGSRALTARKAAAR